MANNDNWWEYPDQQFPDGNSGWTPNDPYNRPPGGGDAGQTKCADGWHVEPSTGGCVPDKAACPDGWAMGEFGKCVELFPGGSGGEGGSGGSGKAGKAGGLFGALPWNPETKPYEFQPWTPPKPTALDTSLTKSLEEWLGSWDKSVPFTDRVIAQSKSSALRSSLGKQNANREAILADQIQRGVFKSSATGSRLDASRRAAQSAFTQASRDIDTTAAVQNDAALYRNRMSALDAAQKHVDNERNFLLQSQMDDFTRQAKLADIQQAYYRLEQERWSLMNGWNLSKYGIDVGSNNAMLALFAQLMNGTAA